MNDLRKTRIIIQAGICGLLLLGSLEARAQEPSQWKRFIPTVQKDGSGVVSGVRVSCGHIPDDVRAMLPATEDERLLSWDEIRALAEAYGLFERTKVNRKLRYQTGDISYWEGEGFFAWELSLEFLARRLVLVRADQEGGTIPTQGDLGYWSDRIIPCLEEEARKKWGSP